MRKKINIAIDGYSSCGKSTLAKSIAKELNYIYIDTGAMYRAMTLFALKSHLIRNDELNVDKLKAMIDSAYITFKYNTDTKRSETHLNGKNVEKEIRSMQVSKFVSPVAAIPEVRMKLVKLQQRMAEVRGVVMDGRDIGTVVLPDAEVKFFMTADPEVRAQRRFNELKNNGLEVTYEEVLENVKQRDQIDSTRSTDPLRQAEDAVVVDNSNLTMDEQFVFAMNHVNKVLAVPS
ncbi:(d)CMP kinase [Sanyastnella coralliicola]|uniref:(d)CMP kinase n=1 Tax=Sanyastnella coralliicola TaxID=3069118 RepID=UPI0027BA7B07|nr:(d)CMP kinase [Longitalea sp. SCSIO 12813]